MTNRFPLSKVEQSISFYWQTQEFQRNVILYDSMMGMEILKNEVENESEVSLLDQI